MLSCCDTMFCALQSQGHVKHSCSPCTSGTRIEIMQGSRNPPWDQVPYETDGSETSQRQVGDV